MPPDFLHKPSAANWLLGFNSKGKRITLLARMEKGVARESLKGGAFVPAISGSSMNETVSKEEKIEAAADDLDFESARQPGRDQVRREPELIEAEEKILKNPYDIEAWTLVLAKANSSDNVTWARRSFDKFLSYFPTSGKYWKMYIQSEITRGADDAVNALFSRCLLSCLDVNLWKFYLSHLKRVKLDSTDAAELTLDSPEAIDLIKAFEFVIENVGRDIDSTQIWNDYIAFLKELKTEEQLDAGAKVSAIRRIYQLATSVPMHSLDPLWREYEEWENKLNRDLARALLPDQNQKYFHARAVYKEYVKRIEGLETGGLALPPKGSVRESRQLRQWKQFIEFVSTNPQRLESKDLHKEITYVYEQCLLVMFRHAEIWMLLAAFEASDPLGSKESVSGIYERALKALPESQLIYMAYADYLEDAKAVASVRAVYERLIGAIPATLPFIQYMRFSRRCEGPDSARQIFVRGHKSGKCGYRLYVAAANMEFFMNNKPKFAVNIYELGLKRHIKNPGYCISYLEFLLSQNNQSNMRVLVERVLSALPKQQSLPVLDQLYELELMAGDVVAIRAVEKRQQESSGQEHENTLLRAVSRHQFMGLWPISDTEAKLMDLELGLESAAVDSFDKDMSRLGIAWTLESTRHLPKPDVSKMTPMTLVGTASVAGLPVEMVPKAVPAVGDQDSAQPRSQVPRPMFPQSTPESVRRLLSRLPPSEMIPLHLVPPPRHVIDALLAVFIPPPEPGRQPTKPLAAQMKESMAEDERFADRFIKEKGRTVITTKQGGGGGRKRRFDGSVKGDKSDSESEDEEPEGGRAVRGPDVYRTRQRQRLNK